MIEVVMRDDGGRQRLGAERPCLVDGRLGSRLVERHLVQHQVIVELEHHTAMVARSGKPPDAFRDRFGGDDDRGRRRRRCRSNVGRHREIGTVAIERVLRDLQIELQVPVHLCRQAARQLHAVHVGVVGETS
jgi:hypothetical protein